MSVRERMVRRLDGLGTLVICTDLAELQAMIGPAVTNAPAPLLSSVAPSAAGHADAGPAAGVDPAATPHDAAVAPGTAAAAAAPGGSSLRGLEIDPLHHLVTWRGQPLPLTRLEHNLLTQLAVAPVRVWTYERLFESVWGCVYLGDSSVLHSAVKRLRQKLRAAGGTLRVHTVRGIGYRLSVD
ncbi:winged helix-turn-helix domain-containing protein [Micromonospora chokoriensis]|uniref:winged helix-turn-helix domain-containing protein n=1 Tax=Micromonospora chokoriensis TaxID=356851 RepID=UPI0038CBFEAB